MRARLQNLPVPDFSALRQLPEDPLCVTIGGGTFSAVAETPECIACDSLTYADAKTPLDLRRVALGVRRQYLALGQTTATLNRFRNGVLDRILETGGNWSTADGLNCLFEFANAAARFTVDNPQVQADCFADYAEVIRLRGGDDSTLRFSLFALLGIGGVSGGAMHILQRAVSLPYVESAAEVTEHRLRIGPVCHEGCRPDNRNAKNHAAALCVDVFWVLRPHPVGEDERDDRTTRLYFATDFLNCGKDDAKRDHLAGTFVQGFLCHELRNKIRVVMCNDNANDFGRIAVLRAGWYKPIDRHKAAQIACQKYAPEIERLLSNPEPAGAIVSVIKVEATHKEHPKAIRFLDLLALAIESGSLAEPLTALASRSPVKYKATGTVLLKNQTALNLGELANHLDSFGPSFSGFKQRQALVAALRPEVAKKLRQAQVVQRRATRLFLWRITIFTIVLAWAFARAGIRRLLSAIVPLPWKSRLLKQAFDRLQQAASGLARATAIRVLLSVANRRLQLEEVRARSTVLKVIAALEPFKTKRDACPPVEMLDIERAWRFLRQLHGAGGVAENRLTLSRLTRRVTAKGLQQILEAEDTSPEALAAAVCTTVPEWAPSFGRDATRTYRSRYRILPPVEPGLRDALDRHLAAEDKERIVYADSCAAGITAIAIDISTPAPLARGGLKELFTPAVRSAFRKSLDPQSIDQFYPDEECQAAARWVAATLKIPFPEIVAEPLDAIPAAKPPQAQSQESGLEDVNNSPFL